MDRKLIIILLTPLLTLTIGWILLAEPPGPPSWAAPPERPMQSLPDLAVTKYIESCTVAPGHYVKYVVFFQNISLYVANDIRIIDTLPVSSTYVSSTGPGLTLVQTGPDQVVWVRDRLSDYEQGWASITVRFEDDAPVGATVSNIVRILTFDSESNFDNNEYILRSEIRPPGPDLSIRKELQSGIVDGGNQISYHIHYDYIGADAAHNVRITDTLPTLATYVSDVNYAGFTTVQAGDTVVWEKSSVAADSSGDLYLNVLIDGDFDPGQDWLENVVEISTSDAETNYDNNVHRFTIKPEADKFYGAAVTSVDDRTMRLLNDGGFDWLIYYLDWSEAEPSKGKYNWRYLDDAIWQAWRYHLKLAVRIDRAPAWARSPGSSETAPPTNPNDLRDFVDAIADRTNIPPIDAYITWNEPNLADEWGGNAPDVAAYTDLLCAAYQGVNGRGLVVSAGLAPTNDDPPNAVDDLIYLQQMYNAGAGACFDRLGANPLGFAYSPDDTSDPNGYYFRRAEVWRQIMVNNGDGAKQMFATEMGWLRDTTTDLGSDYNWMKVSDIDQAHYLVRAYNIARCEWPWMSAMTTWNMDFAGFPANYPDTSHPYWFGLTDQNRDPLRAYLMLKNAATGGPADLWLEKELISPVMPSGDLVYRIHYTNIGGRSAANVVMTDTLPVSTTYVTDTGGGTPVGDNQVVWNIGPVDTCTRETITLTLSLASDGVPENVLTDTLQASTVAGEPYTDDNTATVTTPLSNLSISKSVVPNSAIPGAFITYTLVFSNAGQDTARDVLITDIVPVSVTVQNVVSSGVVITDTGASPPYVWQVQDLAPTEGGIIMITGMLSPTLPLAQVFTNTATITGSTVDLYTLNNTTQVRTIVGGGDIYLPVTIKE